MMFFGIELTVLIWGLIGFSVAVWIAFLLSFLTNKRSGDEASKYFRTMFNSYHKSELRWLWKTILLVLEYIIGMYFFILLKSSWYVSKGIKWIFSKIFLRQNK